jgi:hypothetical protein
VAIIAHQFCLSLENGLNAITIAVVLLSNGTTHINVYFSVERISSIDYLVLKKLVIIKLSVIL